MPSIHTDKDSVKNYFDNSYKNVSTLQTVPWVTGAVGIEILRKMINKEIPHGSKILEVGCGLGTEAVFMQRHGHQVIALDLDASVIEKAKSYAKLLDSPVDFRKEDFLLVSERPEFQEAFDIVMDQGCFHHMLPQDRATYASTLKACLKPGGKYLMRGFSNLMPPSSSGNGPFRLSSDDILSTFSKDFYLDEMYIFDNVPVVGKENVPQKFWFVGLRKR